MNTYDKAKMILTNTITHIEFTGQLKTSIHIYNIACSLDNQNPKSKIERAIEVLFDIVDGKKSSDDMKATKQYLKTVLN